MRSALAAFVLGWLLLSYAWPAAAQQGPPPGRAEPPQVVRRPFSFVVGDAWDGAGVCYGPFRDGQSPDGASPTDEQLREDLRIIAKHWSLIRMYGSRGVAGQVCRIIREDRLPLRIMIGAWIAQESRVGERGEVEAEDPAIAAQNAAEVDRAIQLANEYPGIVLALGIGNETQVSWSQHRVPSGVLIGYLRRARGSTNVPVTTCDDYSFWNKAESKEVARECDFIAVHIYAMWNKQSLLDAMPWTRRTLGDVRSLHGDLPVAITEIGWATQKGTEGYQAVGIVATPDERGQELFFRALRDWCVEFRQPYFYFSAFDENWKGGAEPNEVEKHWGVYNADRSPKLVFTQERGDPR